MREKEISYLKFHARALDFEPLVPTSDFRFRFPRFTFETWLETPDCTGGFVGVLWAVFLETDPSLV